MNIFLDESRCRQNLYPFTHTRHVTDIRIGILTIREKWEKLVEANIITGPGPQDNAISIDANVIPTTQNIEYLLKNAKENKPLYEDEKVKVISYPWNIFQYNEWAILHDFQLLTANKKSQAIHSSNRAVNAKNIFLEEGAIVENSIINADAGPVFFGRNSVIMEGNLIRGPFALCENAVLKMGSRIYGATTIGPGCIAGGEIKNSVMFGYSNKAHEGYLGDSVIGEWCNLGAGTSNSNMKNTAGIVKYYLTPGSEPVAAGNKGGVLMGDYSRTAINTSFNTATIVGVCCNIFGHEIPQKHVNNFSWGHDRYQLEKALAEIEIWKKMKGQSLNKNEKETLQKLYLINN